MGGYIGQMLGASDRRITGKELRACIKDMYETLGYDYSDRYYCVCVCMCVCVCVCACVCVCVCVCGFVW